MDGTITSDLITPQAVQAIHADDNLRPWKEGKNNFTGHQNLTLVGRLHLGGEGALMNTWSQNVAILKWIN